MSKILNSKRGISVSRVWRQVFCPAFECGSSEQVLTRLSFDVVQWHIVVLRRFLVQRSIRKPLLEDDRDLLTGDLLYWALDDQLSWFIPQSSLLSVCPAPSDTNRHWSPDSYTAATQPDSSFYLPSPAFTQEVHITVSPLFTVLFVDWPSHGRQPMTLAVWVIYTSGI